MSDRIETYIYESPDGGDTIYRRKMGDPPNLRELHSQSQRYSDLEQSLKHSKLWGAIHRAAEKDPALKEMLDQIVVYHTLKKDMP